MPPDYSTPNAWGGQSGDIVHVRGSGYVSWRIRLALWRPRPGTWGTHDGLLLRHAGYWEVAEAVGRGYQLTPWDHYIARMERGKARVVFLRHPTATVEQIERIRTAAVAAQGKKYDMMALVAIQLNILFQLNLHFGKEWAWYCTEACRDLFAAEGLDVWEKKLPTPYTTEKRERAGRLSLIGGPHEDAYLEHWKGRNDDSN